MLGFMPDAILTSPLPIPSPRRYIGHRCHGVGTLIRLWRRLHNRQIRGETGSIVGSHDQSAGPTGNRETRPNYSRRWTDAGLGIFVDVKKTMVVRDRLLPDFDIVRRVHLLSLYEF